MIKKFVIDRLLPSVKPIDTENITGNSDDLTVTADIDYGGYIISTIVWRKNIFDDERTALKAYRGQLNKELLAVQYKINSMDKKEE